MARPCNHGDIARDDICAICWKWAHDVRYREKWGGNPQDVTPAERQFNTNNSSRKTTTVVQSRSFTNCLNLGPVLERPSTCSKCWIYACDKHHRCTTRKPAEGITFCGYCPDYKEDDQAGTPAVAAINAGVALGCYGWPLLTELQIRTIRNTCGNVPILICDDASPHTEAFTRLENDYPDVTFWPNLERQGHYAGDLSVFWKAAQWGKRRGLKTVAKLSQRFIFLRPDWLREASELLAASGKAALSQRCIDSQVDLCIRSEVIVMDVERWSSPEILKELTDRGPLRNATELHINHVATVLLGGFAVWPLLTENRYQASPETIWHCTHAPAIYNQHATNFGLTLDADFTTNGRQALADWKQG